MIHEITGCKNCPMANFSEWEYSQCMYPSPDVGNLWDNYFRDVDEGESPSWCPLKKEDITIQLKK